MEPNVNSPSVTAALPRVSWNKGKLIGQKAPLKLKEIYAIRTRLQLSNRVRELALFNLAIDSKLRGCDLVKLRVSDVAQGNHIMPRAIVMQQKTQRPVQFELSEQTRDSTLAWLNRARLKSGDFLFPSRIRGREHISTRQYERLLKNWVKSIGLDPSAYGTHSMRRTKASIGGQRTYAQCSYCSDTPSLNRRCVISALKSTMRLRSLNKRKSRAQLRRATKSNSPPAFLPCAVAQVRHRTTASAALRLSRDLQDFFGRQNREFRV
jgi:Phage integrase family